MRGPRMVVIAVVLGLPILAQAQEATYSDFIQRAEAAYADKDYSASAQFYSKAFESRNWLGNVNDRYNAACSWALAGEPDSAFFQLFRIAGKGMGTDYYEHMQQDTDLASLHADKRWKKVCELIRIEKEKAEANYNRPIMAQLDSIFTDDQSLRMEYEEYRNRYAADSEEMREFHRTMQEKDSINVVKVTEILDTHGWVGPDVVGRRGNTALFLVIQHADLSVQEKYLPMLREAVKNGNASASQLALLEDRVNIRHGKRQIYGSQIGTDATTGMPYVLPLEDPDNVDKRRAEVGLEPLSQYLSRFNIEWDIEEYKKELPEIEAKEKERER